MQLERAIAAKEITALCQRHEVPLSEVCRAAGLKYSTLHAQIHNQRPIPFETIVVVARHFRVPLERFSSYRPDVTISPDGAGAALDVQALANLESALESEHLALMGAGFSIGTDDVLDWLRAQSGKLTNFEGLREHVDLFHPVQSDDKIFRPYRIGRQSLATQSFRAADEAHFRRIVERAMSPQRVARVVAAHREVAVMPYKVSDETIDISVNGERLAGAYRRIMAPVTDLQGNTFTLVHSRRI